MHRTLATLVALLALLARPAAAQRPPVALDTLRVVARTTAAAAATRSVDVITREELERRAGRSLAELIAFALGADVQTRSPAQSDLSLRGSTFNQVVIMVDGVRVNDVQSGHYALDLAVPAAMIERIEILRGAGSALHGSDAIGGVVNIVTRQDGAGALALRGGSFGGASLAGTGGHELGGLRLRAGADVDRSDGHRPGTDYRVVQLRAAAERDVSAGRVAADVGQGVRRFGAADFYSPFNSDETTRTTTAGIRLVPAASRRVAVGGALHYRRHSDLFTLKRDDPAFYQNQHLSREASGEATVRAALSPRLSAAAGLSLLDARLRSARLGDHAQSRLGSFGQLTAALPGAATLDAGLRQDWLSDAAGFLSPSLGVALPVGRGAQLRGSVNRGFRAPTWTERFYVDPANIGDSTLAVERFWSHEVGVRLTPAPWALVDVAYYERHARDLIDWARPAGSPATTPWRTQNFASATYRGVEGTVRLPALAGVDWTVRGAGLRFDPRVAEGTVGKYALRPITRSLGLSAAAPLGGRALLSVDALRARRTGEDDYLHLNARLAVPRRSLTWSLELVNLAGATYLDGSGKPVAGRSAFAGVAWRGGQ